MGSRCSDHYCGRSKLPPQRVKRNHNIVPLYFINKIKSLFSNS